MEMKKALLRLTCLGLFAPFIAAAGGPTPLDTWSFEYAPTNWNWASDGGYLPLSFTNLDYSYLGDGTAVVLDSTNAAWLHYPITNSNGGTELPVSDGTVVFWVAPFWASTNQSGTGPGVSSRLIEVGAYSSDASAGWWSIFTDEGGNTLNFSSADGNGCQTNYISVPISWITNRWHQIALTYSSDAASNTALYLDGQWITNGPPTTCLPGSDALTNGFYIGSDSNGIAQIHGMFDDLFTYDHPLTSNEIASLFNKYVAQYWLNPLNEPANIVSGPSSPTNVPTFVAITGTGFLTNATAASPCLTSTNPWFTNLVARPVVTNGTNWTTTLSFTIAGGSNGIAYDVLATPAPLAVGSITNWQWSWMGQGYHCTNYTIFGLPPTGAFLVLGGPQDSDSDGLTDAYELLVSKTDPHNPSTSGDGIQDGWKYLWGLNQFLNNPAQSGLRENFSYFPEGWLSGVSGAKSETVRTDAEGNVTGN
ncbi:MAG: hypothetical protein C5B50_21875 [Verrucomicrobia bacterium]|nr:MAG: hypothetical protein C5B50_21875 [Verrucomicrobiota bacterium]